MTAFRRVMTTERRLTKELAEINKFRGSQSEQFTAVSSGPLQWTVEVKCPPGGKYGGQVYRTMIYFPTEYPFSPPVVTFLDDPGHRNVYKTIPGTIGMGVCVDILQEKWSPVLSALKVYISVLSLLINGN